MHDKSCLSNVKYAVSEHLNKISLSSSVQVLSTTIHLGCMTSLLFLTQQKLKQFSENQLDNQLSMIITIITTMAGVVSISYPIIEGYYLTNMMLNDCIYNLDQFFEHSEQNYDCQASIFNDPELSYELCQEATLNPNYYQDLKTMLLGLEI